MKAMILAAGLGTRMGALTAGQPKPLLEAGGETLIEHQIRRLVAAQFTDLVINHAAHGLLLEQHLGDGRRYGANIVYSAEGGTPLGTGGGIVQALPLLGREPFMVVNADVWTDFEFARLRRPPPGLAHLVLVSNPDHNAAGDFGLIGDRVATNTRLRLTYSGIGCFRGELFEGCRAGPLALAPLLRAAAEQGRVTGELYRGDWLDVGTPERLERLRRRLVPGTRDPAG
jgi:MurNAc alpha-1-phosphate uridylyltransferase